MLTNNDPALQTGLLSQTCRLQVQDEKFSFTPVKIVAAPRRWDRKPSNGFLARSKSRKVWKRFRSSFNSMKALQRLVAATHEDVDDDLFAEINVSRGLGLVRGVKRQCFGLEDSGNNSDAAIARGRSFLETKWESEATGRRRKLPTKHSGLIDLPAEPIEMDEDFEDGCNHVAGNEEVRDTATSATEIIQDTDASFDLTLDTSIELAPSPTYPRMLHGVTSCLTDLNGDYNSGLKPDDNGQFESESNLNRHILKSATGIASADVAADDREPSLTVEDTDAATASTRAAPVQDLDTERESTLVRSALRSSLDGEDAALLNNFLSKAKAARAAKASVITSQEEKTENTSQEMIDMPTPQTRRVLEELDANSPSPSKPQLSPVKAVDPNDGPAWGDHQLSQDINVNEGEDPQSASPIRRSSRNRTSKVVPRTTTPTLRSLTLRRAKGTEFVFLQRTEAQELALATRRNTRQNRGDAVMPKYVLQALAQQQHEPTNVDDGRSARDLGRKRTTAKKFVTWNETQLVQYEGDGKNGGGRTSNDVLDAGVKATVKGAEKKATSSRSTRSQGRTRAGDDQVAAPTTAPATAPAPGTPKVRRVRQLGASKTNPTPAAAAGTKIASFLSVASTAGGIQKRTKLIPKAPSVVVTGTPVAEKKKILPRASSSSSDDSTDGSTLGLKSKNLLKAHAGSTPMPRRIGRRP